MRLEALGFAIALALCSVAYTLMFLLLHAHRL